MLAELATVDDKPLQHPLAGRDPDLIGERGDRLHFLDRDPPTIRTRALDEPDPIALGHDQRTSVARELELARMDRCHGFARPPTVPYPSPRSRPSRSRMPWRSFAGSIRGHARRFGGPVQWMTTLLIGARLPPTLTRLSTEAPSIFAFVTTARANSIAPGCNGERPGRPAALVNGVPWRAAALGLATGCLATGGLAAGGPGDRRHGDRQHSDRQHGDRRHGDRRHGDRQHGRTGG